MPVLTCPFATIPAAVYKNPELFSYPSKIVLKTELSLKPTATETWSIEGISLSFNTEYSPEYWIDITSPFNTLIKVQLFLSKQLTALKVVETERKQIFEKTPTAETNAELWEAKAAVEGVEHELESLEKEKNELGRTAILEGVRIPQLTMVARVYARGNELVWNSELTPLRFFSLDGNSTTIVKKASGVSLSLAGLQSEIVNIHTQFDDPLDITERENLTLQLELIGPPPIKENEDQAFEGPSLLSFKLSQIQGVVNYSRQVAS